jgi:hypothetical protein
LPTNNQTNSFVCIASNPTLKHRHPPYDPGNKIHPSSRVKRKCAFACKPTDLEPACTEITPEACTYPTYLPTYSITVSTPAPRTKTRASAAQRLHVTTHICSCTFSGIEAKISRVTTRRELRGCVAHASTRIRNFGGEDPLHF